MRLLLGIPTGGDPARPFLESVGALALPAVVTEIQRAIWSGNFVAAQREMLMREAVAGDFDLLAMIDDDIVAPPDALERLVATLLDDERTALAGALYYSRDGARPMAVDGWSSGDTTTAAIPAYTQNAAPEVDGVGFGCAVLRVAALRSLETPYLRAHVYVDPRTRRVSQCDEDYLFCERLRQAGHTVRLDAGVRCGHFDRRSSTIYPTDWEPDATTGIRRMIVAENGAVRLAPFDDRVPRARERHERVDVEYLFSES